MKQDKANDAAGTQQAEERFRLVVESSPAAIVIVDQFGKIVLVNRQTEHWFGYDRSELIGQEIEVLIPLRFHDQHRKDRDAYLAAPQTRPMGVDHDLQARRKDETEFPVDISLHPMLTESGVLVMSHIVDLTDRKRAELETKRRHAMERLALLGQLAGGVAHEIRNPLGVIRNATYYLELIGDSLDADAQASIAEIKREVDRANHIVGDLLDYARDPQQTVTTFDLVAKTQEAVDQLRYTTKATIEFFPTEESLFVLADPDQCGQILVNLLRNGIQATQDDSPVNISVKRNDAMALVDVTDRGPGIAEEDRSRIFEPLYTTKATGIGLGLTVSKRYAEANGGHLDLLANSNGGSTFRLTLPLRRSHTE
ncbi:MAG: PAS domain S-box protein [Planctomycetaceae bacterium]|nr:PAS domain S-box protein [Planctomycetaceae bacterium]